MRTVLRRMLLLILVGAGGAAAMRVVRSRRAGVHPLTSVAPETSWPPFTSVPEMIADADADATADPTAADPTAADPTAANDVPDWIEPVDGACPETHPIKANDNSHIYHLPGGRFYARTIPQRCYATTEAAERDGYRRAKA